LIERPPARVGKVVLGAVARVAREAADVDFQLLLAGVLVRAFEESISEELERPALQALRSLACLSEEEAVQTKVVDALVRGMWLGTVAGSHNLVRTMQALGQIGAVSSSVEVKRSAVDGLAQCIFEIPADPSWHGYRTELAVNEIAKVAATSEHHTLRGSLVMSCAETWTQRPTPSVQEAVLRALNLSASDDDVHGESPGLTMQIVRLVGLEIMHSTQQAFVTRALDWLVVGVLAGSNSSEVRSVVLEAGSWLASSDRVEVALESLYQIVVEGWEGAERESFRDFAAGMLASCSSQGLRKASGALVRLASERRLTWVKKEMVSWLGLALGKTTQESVARSIVDGILEMALRGNRTEESVKVRVIGELIPVLQAPTLEIVKLAMAGLVQIALSCGDSAVALPVVEALADRAHSEDLQVARSAVRNLAKLAGETDNVEVRMSLAQRLGSLLLTSDLVMCGVIAGSAHVDAAFHEHVEAALDVAMQRAPHMELRVELEDASLSLSRIAEQRLQDANDAPEAKGFAPAA